jgi:hypothetical protein
MILICRHCLLVYTTARRASLDDLKSCYEKGIKSGGASNLDQAATQGPRTTHVSCKGLVCDCAYKALVTVHTSVGSSSTELAGWFGLVHWLT